MSKWSGEDIAWLAGLLEGEAWFGYNRTPQISLKMKDRDIVEKAHKLMGSPSIRNVKGTGLYVTTANGKQAFRIMDAVLPFMGERRARKIKEVLSIVGSEPKWGRWRNSAKLKEEYIPIIRALIERGVPQYKIAETCGVHPTTISQLYRGESWDHV